MTTVPAERVRRACVQVLSTMQAFPAYFALGKLTMKLPKEAQARLESRMWSFLAFSLL